MDRQKILIGMSGGVDSSVAAQLMLHAGFDCIGATMLLCQGLPGVPSQDPSDARAVADRLNIPFCVLDGNSAFREAVVSDFVESYEAGLTPNPCIRCNQHLKFRFMLDKALEMGCHGIATGHYAQIRKDPESGRYLLCKAADEAKDQSYFLYCLDQDQLSRTYFPLGSYTKDQIRRLADTFQLPTAHRKDSQDICFIPDGEYVKFLKDYTGKTYPEGKFLDLQGNPVGTHNGAVAYTLGQRKGLGLAIGQPVYVCSKDMANNSVTVGPDSALYHNSLLADSWNWIAFDNLTQPIEALAKVRYRHPPQPAIVIPQDNGFCKVTFCDSQRAITPGQAVVLYRDDVVLGGGTIRKVL